MWQHVVLRRLSVARRAPDCVWGHSQEICVLLHIYFCDNLSTVV